MNRGSFKAAILRAGVATAAVLAAAPALAADDTVTAELAAGEVAADAADAGEVIVVTARRREESSQEVPIALSVVSGDTLQQTGNFSISQVQQLIPSLQVTATNPRNSNINIRGLGANSAVASGDGLEYGVGFYVDGVYYGRPGQSAFGLLDISQIEVLRGPRARCSARTPRPARSTSPRASRASIPRSRSRARSATTAITRSALRARCRSSPTRWRCGSACRTRTATEFDLAPRWDALTAEQKALSSRRMEVFAAMVDRMDWNVGRVVEALRASGELDDTVILFLSDNGAEGSILSGAATAASRERNSRADNSLDNIGAANSYDSIGPGWAEAATAPSWRVKAFQTEGGTRSVSFLSGPGIRQGVGAAFTSVMDVAPTFLDIARVAQPRGSFAGRTLKPIRGQSWAPWLAGHADRVYPENKPVGAELFGGRALRQGDWKLLDRGDGRWRLFNLAADPGETRDLAASEPRRKAALQAAWEAYAGEVGVVLPEGPQRVVTRPAGR